MRKTTIRSALTLLAVLFARDLHASSLPGFALLDRTEEAAYYARGNDRPDMRRIEAYLGELESLLGTTAPPSRYFLYGYPVAGSFVAWLIETHGLDSVTAFFRLSAQGSPRAFDEAFGLGLEEAGRDWRRAL